MKKITSLFIACSLALAGAAVAQQPEEQPSPKSKSAEKGKGPAAEAKHAAKDGNPAAAVPEAKKAPHAPKVEKSEAANAPGAPVSEKPLETSPKHHAAEKTPATAPSTAAAPNPADPSAPPETTAPVGKKHGKGKNEAKAAAAGAPSTAAAPSAAPAIQPKAQAAAAKKPDPQKVQEIKAQHANFHAQPKPDQVPTVTFSGSRRIEGSDHWQGQQYEAFRSYHPERHDEQYYRSHYDHVELVGGGYYYQRDGYWYPAWGYNPSSEYYAYDGPIYAGHRAEPPDRVIADVQGALQNMDYYKGEVDGLLGPMTREALTGYQNDQGLTPTAAIDEPTLDALGLN